MQCDCGNYFEPTPDKPGLITQCWECGREEEQSRSVDPVIASQGDHVNGWQAMPRSKFFTVADVAASDYHTYVASEGGGAIARLTRCTYGDVDR